VARKLRIAVPDSGDEVSGLIDRPLDADCLLVFAHGAGADMNHAFMEATSQRLTALRIATLRYQFPYMEQGRRSPSPRGVLLATVRAAVAEAASQAPDLPLLAGGKSMGGRMTSLAASEAPLPRVEALVFFGFPLYPAGKPSTDRADHLADVPLPMLFLQGTRDKLADLELLERALKPLGSRTTLHIVEGADHSFHVLKRSGRTDPEALDELATTLRHFTDLL
jgi:predicted alpha/beta-hydrolase family hydrolase